MGVQQKRARAVPDPMGGLPSLQSCSFCTDPSSQQPHLQFKNTHWLETATKRTAHCLPETLFDHAAYVCVHECGCLVEVCLKLTV